MFVGDSESGSNPELENAANLQQSIEDFRALLAAWSLKAGMNPSEAVGPIREKVDKALVVATQGVSLTEQIQKILRNRHVQQHAPCVQLLIIPSAIDQGSRYPHDHRRRQ